MTQTDKTIFAMVYALEYQRRIRNHPREVLVPGALDAWGEWESEQVVGAIEAAVCAVERFREPALVKHIEERYDDHVCGMYKEMLS